MGRKGSAAYLLHYNFKETCVFLWIILLTFDLHLTTYDQVHLPFVFVHTY